MGYFKNSDTNGMEFYHGSKTGIKGQIAPNKSAGAADFGEGFYLGTREMQTLSRVSNEPSPFEYKFNIPDTCINKNNTIYLGRDEWMFFVLYNRRRLEDMQGTEFYEHYKHLADGKDFVIGPIADDVYDMCVKDFCDGQITDWTYQQLIDCFDYGIQVVAKSQRACDCLEKTCERAITKEERKELINSRKLTRKQRVAYYLEKRAEFNAEHRGEFLSEIKDTIRIRETVEVSIMKAQQQIIVSQDEIKKCQMEINDFQNINFPSNIHAKESAEYGLF